MIPPLIFGLCREAFRAGSRGPALAQRLLLGLIGLGALVHTSAADEPFPRRHFTPVERLEPDRLQAVHEARERFARERVALPELTAFGDYRAVIHVHAEDSKHTLGTRQEVLAAAKKTGVRVVILTDHRGPKPETWRGERDGVLFLAGSEESDGRLRLPASSTNGAAVTAEELQFICHVEERLSIAPQPFAGLEIVNRHTDQKLDRRLEDFLLTALTNPPAWARLTNSLARWPDEIFAAGCDYRPEIFRKWDTDLKVKPMTGIGANDAHQNVVVGGVTFDPYAISFRHLSTHLLLRELTEEQVRRALKNGHCYVAHDWLADPTGFTFGAINNLGVFPMGARVLKQGTTRLVGVTPLPARHRLIHDGQVVAETNGTNLTFRAKQSGAYRLEAWLEVAGEWRPWIYSNPVYLKEPTLLDVPLPDMSESDRVEVRKDLAYATDPSINGADAAKQRLDLYLPRSVAPAPVFVFVHGGAWRTGDRSLYGPVGQRFARDGIVTVIPSYRLAPKAPWPAQAEDTAAAIAWTFLNIARHGGDTNRIFVGGHSAGGHLTSLIALRDRFLQPYGLSPKLLRGVISLSGVYNLELGDALTSVFGRDQSIRRAASPLAAIGSVAPPFLITYCEWDYPTLPAQAKNFHATLEKAGVASQLHFTPENNHIYEMFSLTYDDDVTARAVVQFIRNQAPAGQPIR